MTRILNLARLDRKLQRMPVKAKAVIRQAMEAQADEIVAMAKSLAPVDDGTLRDSIGWTWGKAPKGALTLGKVVASDLASDLTLTIYAGNEDAFYARWVEFGTAPHSLAPGADISRRKRQAIGDQHPGAKKHPFFYPSWRAKKKEAGRKVRAAVRKAARDVASGS